MGLRGGLSISLIKQELIKGLPVPMQAGGLSHIMHNLLDDKKKKKKASPHNEEIKSRVKSNSRGIIETGHPCCALNLIRSVYKWDAFISPL